MRRAIRLFCSGRREVKTLTDLFTIGPGPYTPSEVSSFSQFLRRQNAYGEPIDRFRVTRSSTSLALKLLTSEEWMSVESVVSFLQLMLSQRLLESDLGIKCINYLISNVSALTLEDFITTVLTSLPLLAEDDVKALVLSIGRYGEELSSVRDLLVLSKCIRAASGLAMRSPSAVEALRGFSEAAASSMIRALHEIGNDSSSLFTEQLSTTFGDVARFSNLYDVSTRNELCSLLVQSLGQKVAFLKSHHVMNALSGLANARTLLGRGDLVSLASRLLDRFGNLEFVITFTECASVVDSLTTIICFLRVNAETGSEREDIVDLEIEVSAFVSRCLRRLAVPLSRNLFTSPALIRISSRQIGVQKQIPSRVDLNLMIRSLVKLCIGLPPAVFLWLHGSMLDTYYKCEIPVSNYMSSTRSGKEALYSEWRLTMERDILRPCNLRMLSEDVATLPRNLSIGLEWASFGTKYGRRTRAVSEDALSESLALYSPALNNISETKSRFVSFAHFVAALVKNESNLVLMGVDAVATQSLKDCLNKALPGFNDNLYDRLIIDPEARVETLLSVLCSGKVLLTAAHIANHKRSRKRIDYLRTAIEKTIVCIENTLSTMDAESIRSACGRITDNQIVSYASMAIYSNVLGAAPGLLVLCLFDELESRMAGMVDCDLHYLLNVFFPKQDVLILRKIECPENMRRALLRLKDECVKRLRSALSRGHLSFATDITYLRCIGVAICEHADTDDELQLAKLVFEDALLNFRRHCVGSASILIRASEELDALAVRLELRTERSRLHDCIVQCFSTLVKSDLVAFSDYCCLMRSFGRSYPKGCGVLGNYLESDEVLPIRDQAVLNLHARLIALSSNMQPREQDFTPLSLAFDLLASVHKSQWRTLFVPCVAEGFLNAVRTSSLVQKSSFCETIARVLCTFTGLKRRVPWALSEYLHYVGANARAIVSVLKQTSDRSFNTQSLARLSRRVPMMPIENIVTLLSFPLVTSSKTGQTAYFYLAERILESILCKLSLRTHQSKYPEILNTYHRYHDKFSDLAPPFTRACDSRVWCDVVSKTEAFREVLVKDTLSHIGFGLMALSIMNSYLVDRVTSTAASEDIRSCAIATKDFLESGRGNMSEGDKADCAYFFSDEASSMVPKVHSSSFYRLTATNSLSVGHLAVALSSPESPKYFQRDKKDATGLTEGYLSLCDALSKDKVIFMEPHHGSLEAFRKYRSNALSSLKTLRTSKQRNVRKKVSSWCEKYRPFTKSEGTQFVAKTSYATPERTFIAVFTEQVIAEYGSVARCPHVLPYFRSAAMRELYSFPKHIASGSVTSFNAYALLCGCEGLGKERLLRKCLSALDDCAPNIKESINIKGLSNILSCSSDNASSMHLVIRNACLNHILGSTDECFGRTMSNADDLGAFLEYCGDLVRNNASLQQRIVNRLEVVLPQADGSAILRLLKVFVSMQDSSFYDDLRLQLSRIPLYICNDLNQFRGSELIRICGALNEAKLLGQTTLDSILEKIQCTDESNEERWVPSAFEGASTESALSAFAKERNRVASALQGLTLNASEMASSPTEDTIE